MVRGEGEKTDEEFLTSLEGDPEQSVNKKEEEKSGIMEITTKGFACD